MNYFQPLSMREAIDIVKEARGPITIIAGGTNVIPDMRAKAVVPKALIDISRLRNLAYVKEEKRKIRIGALTTISELSSSGVIQKVTPILYEASSQLGNPLVRNRATIAGNLADASPAADTAVPLLALEATIATTKREIPIDQFFIGPNKTILKRDEIIKEIVFLKPNSDSKMAYFKLGLRNAMAISVVSLAILMEMEGRECKKARIGLGSVAPTPIRAYRTEEMLEKDEVTPELIEACGREVTREVEPITDIRATAEYRREMTSVLLRRLIEQLTVSGQNALAIGEEIGLIFSSLRK